MQSIVCVGGKEAFVAKLRELVSEFNVPKYGVVSHEGKFKIEDAKSMRRMISGGSNINRVFVLPSEITVPAQNALLKTLEELPDGAYCVIHSLKREDILPTIRSRSKVIFLPADDIDISKHVKETVDKFLGNPSLLNALSAGEVLSDKKLLDEAILYLRLRLKGEESKRAADILNSIFCYYHKLSSNNLNVRMTADMIFLENTP